MSKKMPRRNGAQHQAILHELTSYGGGGSGDECDRLNRGLAWRCLLLDSVNVGVGIEPPAPASLNSDSVVWSTIKEDCITGQ